MRPRIPDLDSWSRFEENVLEVVSLALIMLREEQSLPRQENDVNLKLYFCMRRANRNLLARGKGIPWPFVYECPLQPFEDDVVRNMKDSKRPDFQWGFIDLQRINRKLAELYYVIECKRLGTPDSPNWIFNKNYILRGAIRFKDAGYGKGASSGAMIGYIQSMDLSRILEEVNTECAQKGLVELTLSPNGWQEGNVSRLDQQLQRPKVPPVTFCLRHLWVDIRTHFTVSRS